MKLAQQFLHYYLQVKHGEEITLEGDSNKRHRWMSNIHDVFVQTADEVVFHYNTAFV